MDRSDVIYLIGTTQTQDDNGVWRPTTTRRKVFASRGSITRAEFFEAGRNGLNPQHVFNVFFGNYQGEEVVEYNGKTYSVYRTYQAGTDDLELYVERKGGTNGYT